MVVRILSVTLAVVVLYGACTAPVAGGDQFVELFSIPIGFSKPLFFYHQISGASRYQNAKIEMNNGIFTIASGFTNKINRYTSYGDLVFSLYDRARNGGVVPAQLDAAAVIASRYTRTYPFNFISDVAVSTHGVFYIADRVSSLQVEYDDALASVLETRIVRYDARADTIAIIGQEGIGGTPFPHIHDIHIVDDNQLVVVCDIGDTWLVFWYSEQGRLLYQVEFTPAALPALLTVVDAIEIETIVPDPRLDRLYIKLDYYHYRSRHQTDANGGLVDIVSRLYWLALPDGAYQEYIELSLRSAGNDRSVVAIPQFLGITDNSQLVFYSLPSDQVMDIFVMDVAGTVLLRRSVDIAEERILFIDFALSPAGIITALIGHERETRVLWWRLDQELAKLTA